MTFQFCHFFYKHSQLPQTKKQERRANIIKRMDRDVQIYNLFGGGNKYVQYGAGKVNCVISQQVAAMFGCLKCPKELYNLQVKLQIIEIPEQAFPFQNLPKKLSNALFFKVISLPRLRLTFLFIIS